MTYFRERCFLQYICFFAQMQSLVANCDLSGCLVSPLRSVQLVYSSIKRCACCEATFVPAQQPGTVGWPRNIAGLYAQRQQAGAECVVTRCRVSGNPLLVLLPKEVLRNHGFLSAFFVSFVALQKTPARGRNIPRHPVDHEELNISGANPSLWGDQGYSRHLHCNDCKPQ